MVQSHVSGDALEWLANLDADSPKLTHWAAMQKSLLEEFPATFHGKDHAELLRFTQNIQRRAYHENRETDDVWIAQLVGRSLAEPARSWHRTLSLETKSDWALLQTAMLAKWKAPDEVAQDDTAAG